MTAPYQVSDDPCWMRRRFTAAAAALALAGAAGCGQTPTAPSGRGPTGNQADIAAIDVSCPASLLIGQRGPCVAFARLPSGQPVPVLQPLWSSTQPDVVAVDAVGLVTGRSAGHAVVAASSGGRQGGAAIAVIAADALRIEAAAEQGEFRPGTTVTMWLQGYYSIDSAETGHLRLRISDQDGLVTATEPRVVAKGGDFFLLSSTIVVPPRSTELCRTALLEVGSIAVEEPQSNDSGLRCVAVRR